MSEVWLGTVGTQRVSNGTFADIIYLGPRARLNIFRWHQLEMAPATDAEPQHIAGGCTSDHSAKMTPQQQAEFKSRHQDRVWSTSTDPTQCVASLYSVIIGLLRKLTTSMTEIL